MQSRLPAAAVLRRSSLEQASFKLPPVQELLDTIATIMSWFARRRNSKRMLKNVIRQLASLQGNTAAALPAISAEAGGTAASTATEQTAQLSALQVVMRVRALRPPTIAAAVTTTAPVTSDPLLAGIRRGRATRGGRIAERGASQAAGLPTNITPANLGLLPPHRAVARPRREASAGVRAATFAAGGDNDLSASSSSDDGGSDAESDSERDQADIQAAQPAPQAEQPGVNLDTAVNAIGM